MKTWVIFTDLDESLLDGETYSCDAAREALDELRRRKIPVVFCTSKTAAEILHLQRELKITAPFIIEGGGGLGVPKGYFQRLPGTVVDRGEYHLIPLAAGYTEVLRGLGHLKEFTANSIRGFDDMAPDEISRHTGLPPELAVLAKAREFDEPFHFVRRETEFAPYLTRVAGEVGLRVTKGGRFYHLHGDTDKGKAVRLLKSLFKAGLGEIRTVGVGDSEMDMPLLRETDVPVIIPRRDGTIDFVLELNVPKARRARTPGSKWWNDSIKEIVHE